MKIACTVMCFDRPHYFEPVIRSFEKAMGANEIDWFFFQDGAVNYHSEIRYGIDGDINEVARLIKESTLPIKKFTQQEYNISPAQQRYLMYQVLQDYDLLYVFDDDMVIGEHYLKLLREMSIQFPKHTGILFTTGHANVTRHSLKTLKEVRIARLWGHYMTRNNWLKFEKDHNAYYNMMKEKDFFIYRRQGSFKELPKEAPVVGDDKVVNYLCRKYNIQKLAPKISRATYIGKYGSLAYKLDTYWKKQQMANQRETITFPQDKNLGGFIK